MALDYEIKQKYLQMRGKNACQTVGVKPVQKTQEQIETNNAEIKKLVKLAKSIKITHYIICGENDFYERRKIPYGVIHANSMLEIENIRAKIEKKHKNKKILLQYKYKEL